MKFGAPGGVEYAPPSTVIEGDALVLNAPDGVADEQAQARRDRADARRAERDRRRAAERELRKERDAQRDAARQEERRRLLREKKARKQAEREARARAAGAIIPTRRTAKTRRNAAPVQRAAPVKPQARVEAPVVQPRAAAAPVVAAPPIPPKKKGPPPMKKAITVPQEVVEGEFYWQHTDGEQRGPSTWPEYKQAHSAGETNAELLVYCADVADEWKAASEVPNLMAYVEAPDAPAPKPPKPPPVPRMLAVPSAREPEPEPEPSSEFEAWDGDPDSIVAAAPAPQPEPEPASAEVRSEVSDLTDNTPAPVAASAPVRQAPVVAQFDPGVRCLPRRRGASMASGPRTHPHTGLLRRAPATKLKFKKRAGPGDGEAGTFKIDIMAAVFGSCKCGKLKADHIGPDLKCPPC